MPLIVLAHPDNYSPVIVGRDIIRSLIDYPTAFRYRLLYIKMILSTGISGRFRRARRRGVKKIWQFSCNMRPRWQVSRELHLRIEIYLGSWIISNEMDVRKNGVAFLLEFFSWQFFGTRFSWFRESFIIILRIQKLTDLY